MHKFKKIIFPFCGKDAVVIAVANNPQNIKLKKIDIRSVSPIGIYSRKDEECIVIQSTKETKKITFVRPNNIALFLNRFKKNRNQIKLSYKKLFENKKAVTYQEGNDLSELFNYFELIQESIIAIYTAIEVFANLALPKDYKMSKKNNKGIEEIWNKDNIERHISLSEKVGTILPEALHVPSPKKEPFWSDFKNLQSYRNDIIHQKTIDDMDIYINFTKKRIFRILDAGFKVILYFYQFDKDNTIFPYKFANNKIPIIECDGFEQILENSNKKA